MRAKPAWAKERMPLERSIRVSVTATSPYSVPTMTPATASSTTMLPIRSHDPPSFPSAADTPPPGQRPGQNSFDRRIRKIAPTRRGEKTSSAAGENSVQGRQPPGDALTRRIARLESRRMAVEQPAGIEQGRVEPGRRQGRHGTGHAAAPPGQLPARRPQATGDQVQAPGDFRDRRGP